MQFTRPRLSQNLYSENNCIGVPSFILSGAPFFDRSRIKPGTVTGPVSTLG